MSIHVCMCVQQILKRKWEEEKRAFMLHDGTSTNQSHIMKAESSVHKYIRSLCISDSTMTSLADSRIPYA